MITDQREFQQFHDSEKWIEAQRKKYPKELLVLIKKDEEKILIAHSKTEKDLFKQLDLFFEKNMINQEEIIYFDS